MLSLLLLSFILVITTLDALPLYYNESTICENGNCIKKNFKYELILPAQPGYQWDDAGGYCGSWAIQRATLTKGAWISQQQVRDHTVDGKIKISSFFNLNNLINSRICKYIYIYLYL